MTFHDNPFAHEWKILSIHRYCRGVGQKMANQTEDKGWGSEVSWRKPECGSEFLDLEYLFGLPTLSYKPPSVTGVEDGPQPAALCACTVTVQFGIKSTVKYVVSVVPSTVCVNVPAPSLPVIVI